MKYVMLVERLGDMSIYVDKIKRKWYQTTLKQYYWNHGTSIYPQGPFNSLEEAKKAYELVHSKPEEKDNVIFVDFKRKQRIK